MTDDKQARLDELIELLYLNIEAIRALLAETRESPLQLDPQIGFLVGALWGRHATCSLYSETGPSYEVAS